MSKEGAGLTQGHRVQGPERQRPAERSMDPDLGSWSWFQEPAAVGGGRVDYCGMPPWCPCFPNYTKQSGPGPSPWVLTASSVPLNRMPVECGRGGRGGATGGGRRGGSSLLLRHGPGFTKVRGSVGPGTRVKSRACLSRMRQEQG